MLRIILLCAITLYSGATKAQTINNPVKNLTVAADGSCNFDVINADIKSEYLQYRQAYILSKSPVLRRSSGAQSQRISRSFDDKKHVLKGRKCLAYDAQQGTALLLLEEGRDRSRSICAWVSASDLLQGHRYRKRLERESQTCPGIEVMKSSDLSAGGAIDESPLDAKALIWNQNARSLEEAESSKVYLYPNTLVGLDRLKVYDTFDVYAEQENGDELYYLLGTHQPPVFTGWVRGQDMTFWNNRTALYFKEQGEIRGQYIYEGENDLLKAVRSGKFDEGVVGERPNNLVELINNPEAAHAFPLLRDNISKYYEDLGLRGMEIAFLGNTEASSVSTSDLDSYILFLIDGTESMRPFFLQLARAISTVVSNELQVPSQVEKRIGVAIYGDYLESKSVFALEDSIQLRMLMNFIPPSELSANLNKVAKSGNFRDKQQDKPEAVFAALYQAIVDKDSIVKWPKKKHNRIVIHIGDHNDRSDLPPLKLLEAFDKSNTFYFPIAVAGKYSAENNKAFVRQAQTLAAQLNDLVSVVGGKVVSKGQLSSELRRAYEESLESGKSSDKTIAKAKFEEALTSVLRTIDEAVRSTSDSITGRQNTDKRVRGAELIMSQTMRERLGLGDEDIARARIAETQFVSRGYIVDGRSGHEHNWDRFVVMQKDQYTTVYNVMSVLCAAVGGRSGPHTFKVALSSALESITGDSLDTEAKFGVYLRRLAGIPSIDSTLYSRSINDLMNVLFTGGKEEQDDIKKAACRSSFLLETVRMGRRVKDLDSLSWNKDAGQYSGKSTEFNWEVKRAFGSPLYYIPIEYFPQ